MDLVTDSSDYLNCVSASGHFHRLVVSSLTCSMECLGRQIHISKMNHRDCLKAKSVSGSALIILILTRYSDNK